MGSSKIKILVTGSLTPEGLALLKQNQKLFVQYSPGLMGTDLHEALKDVDGMVIRTETTITKELLKMAPQLKVICRAGIGVDHIDLKACAERKIVVMNTPEANRISTAEHALALLMAMAKKIPLANEALHHGRWDQSQFEGLEISGKTLGIVGLGNIGQRVATRAQALGLRVLARDPYLDPHIAEKLGVPLLPLHETLTQSHFVSLHVPLTPETRGMADEIFLKTMRKDSFLINTSRGPVVNEEALLKVVQAGHLQGAGLDVFYAEPLTPTNPLIKEPRIILTPHVAGKSKESQVAISTEAAGQICIYFEQGKTLNVVSTVNL